MIFLVLTAYLFLPTDALSSWDLRSFRSHFSDNVKLKCDALPYRSIFAKDRCYFAVLTPIVFSEAPELCSRILKGSQTAENVPSDVFDDLMVKKSTFHLDSDSSGAKNVICSYATDYKCEDDTEMHSGRCLVRAPKKMNFADATNYCADKEMHLPAPSNDLGNRLVRDALVKDPAWVHRSSVSGNQFKWSGASSYTRWTTCDRPAEHEPRLYAGNQNSLWGCTTDTASVVDRSGYWSNGAVSNLMDVVCVKNANNDFTKIEKERCADYHADFADKKLLPLAKPATGDPTDTGECYVSTRTTTRYEVLDRSKVETQRGCEALCSVRMKCVAFAYKEAGISSPCTLLTSKATAQVCANPTTIFKKTKIGCPTRTNITAEFGEDPCIDRIVPNAFLGVGRYLICNKLVGEDRIVIRVVDFNGRRITLDNDHNSYLDRVGNYWRYRFHPEPTTTIIPIVAAACVVAGEEKCPCTELAEWKPVPQATPAIMNVVNACGRPAYLHTKVAKLPGKVWVIKPHDTPKSYVTCHAGMWLVYEDSVQNTFGVDGLACE